MARSASRPRSSAGAGTGAQSSSGAARPSRRGARAGRVDRLHRRAGRLVHPNLEGRTDLRFEGLAPPRRPRDGRRAHGLPTRSARRKRPRSWRRARASWTSRATSVCGIRRPTRILRRAAPVPPRADRRTFVYGLPSFTATRSEGAVPSPRPAASRRTIELALLPSRRRAPGGGRRGRRQSRDRAERRRAERGDAPPGAREQPAHVQAARAQHIPEIARALFDAGAPDVTVRLVPVSAPLARGIFATCFAHVDAGVGADAITSLFRDRYRGEPFVRVPAGRLPEVVAVRAPTTPRSPPYGRRRGRQARRRLLRRDRQPGQGGGRAGHPVDEPHARARRAGSRRRPRRLALMAG